ncbi:hypothetical protein ACE1BH_24755 [Aeromonas jandaei]
MSSKKQLTEQKLYDALKRLLDGNPTNVKSSGKITLNKVNNEARLGNSYVHKFPEFVTYANDVIAEYNNNLSSQHPTIHSSNDESYLENDKLRDERNRERRLKERYRIERDDAIQARIELEKLNNTLMFRLYELQEKLDMNNKLSNVSFIRKNQK